MSAIFSGVTAKLNIRNLLSPVQNRPNIGLNRTFSPDQANSSRRHGQVERTLLGLGFSGFRPDPQVFP
jgi:hypothetical protein